MKNLKYHFLMAGILLSAFNATAQVDLDDDLGGSVIQNLTPSKLIAKGQWDLKLFNNFFTQDDSTFESEQGVRQNFFTSTLEVFTGVSDTRRVNVGVIAEYRINSRAFTPGGEMFGRSGLSSIAPSIKIVPFKNVGNFSLLSSLSIPLFGNEVDDDGVFLDQKGFTWQNRFFFDYTFPGKKWQIFSELNTEFNFGDQEESFANNSLNLVPGVFLSYFPSSKFTISTLVQHNQRLDLGNDFTQNFTAVGGGAKYQLTKELNIEVLYTNFVRGENTGLGETFNLGLRAVF